MVNASSATAVLSILISAKDEASGEISGIGGKIKGIFDGIPGPAKVAGAAGAGAVLAIGAAALKVGADFDSAYDTIRIGTGATGDALKGLQGDFKAVFGSIPTDMGTASTAVAELNTRLGLTGKPLQELSKQVIELSRITGTDLGTNIESVTRAFGDWSIDTDTQSDALDKLFQISQATGPSVDRLSQLIVQFGAPMRQFGFDMVESAALLAKFEKEGVNTELVMGSLRIAGAKFAKENIPLRQGLEDVISKIQEMGPSAEATALAMEIFGTRAGVDMVDTILNGKFAIEDFVKSLDGSSETILGVASDTNDMAESWTVFKNQVLVLVEPLLTKMFSTLSAGIATLTKFIMTTKEMLPALLDGAITVDDFAAKFGAFGTTAHDVALIIADVALFIRDNWGTLEAIFGFIHDYVKTRIEGMIQYISSIVEIVTSVVNLIDALSKGDWSRAWNEMKDIAGAVIEAFIGLVKMHFGNIPWVIIGLINEAVNAAERLASSIVDAIVRFLETLPAKAAKAGREAAQAFLDSISVMGVSAGDIVRVGGGIVGGLFSSGLDYVPYDNFPARLHRGERILTAQENREYSGRAAGSGITVNNYGPIYARDMADAERGMGDIAWALSLGRGRRGF